ncbi:MAG: GNAT family N-acetyltransferase [Thermomicrobiales bacterium]|nr:GNAT family N-acetyltransferase [Thermomicrobiales bacterium]
MSEPESVPYTAADLGFAGDARVGWVRRLRGGIARFRCLRTIDDLVAAERLQSEVFGMSERDLLSASGLLTVAETGGEVLGAFVDADAAQPLAGVLIGWGGFVDGTPRLVSDVLAVVPERRNLGLGAELKRLQAAVALERGFREVVWTVDPLRAANARLNFEKLGATAAAYEENRYGAAFAAGLYGGMPTDRLHVRWELAGARVRDRLLGGSAPTPPNAARDLPSCDPSLTGVRCRINLPADIDALVAADPEAALRWRFALRAQLRDAFASGWRIVGFAAETDLARGISSYLLERDRL